MHRKLISGSAPGRVVLMAALLLAAALVPVIVVGRADAQPAAVPAAALPPKLFYYGVNLSTDKAESDMEAVMRRAAKAGYTGFILAGGSLARIEQFGPHYIENSKRIRKLAEDLKLEVIPTVFPLGYSSSILFYDPNLAEALPVRDALFVVKGATATLQPEPAVTLPAFDKWDSKDLNITVANGVATIANPTGNHTRLIQKLAVKPFRHYHMTLRIKTAGYRGEGEPFVKVLSATAAPGLDYTVPDHAPQGLNFVDIKMPETQDWKTYDFGFNSLENDAVNIMVGSWKGKAGTIQFAEPTIAEVGLVNLVRRPGAPLVIKTEAGKELKEGVDFETLVDPKMGYVEPYKGDYDIYHQPPVIKLLPAAGLAEGTRLRVSYYHAVIVHDTQAMLCPSEPKSIELLREQARKVHELWGAKSYIMGIDEVRIFNQCGACRAKGLDAGGLMAETAKTCTDILRQVNPGGKIYVWSDMFDPYHNAHDNYYLTRGDLAGAWKGLDKDVIIAMWYVNVRDQDMPFFVQLGHKILMCGYYDDPKRLTQNVHDWLGSSKKLGYENITGIMYTTWNQEFDHLEEFGKVVDETR